MATQSVTRGRRISVLGCPFDVIAFDEVIESIRTSVRTGVHLQVVPANVDFVMKARRSARFAELLDESDLVVPDGVPILWSAAILGNPLRGRVSGTDLAMACARLSHEDGWRLALVGGAPGVAEHAARNMTRAYPKARVVAVPTPPISDEATAQAVADAVRSCQASVVQVALGAPKQEAWLRRYLVSTGATVGIGVGSALDIISGDQPRAPRWMRDHGLEWAQRLRLEPRRLARRYLVDDALFFPLVARATVRQRLVSGRRRYG